MSFLPDWDGAYTDNNLLPEWAAGLPRDYPRYTFVTTQLHDGRGVVAVLRGTGRGPVLVICRSEDEMRQALGAKTAAAGEPGAVPPAPPE